MTDQETTKTASNGQHPEDGSNYTLRRVELQGYRPFRHLAITLDSPSVLVGANGSGKTAFFEFLQFLRDSMEREIPPGVLKNGGSKRIFHAGTEDDRFQWRLNTHRRAGDAPHVDYKGEILGPVGQICVPGEGVLFSSEAETSDLVELLDVRDGEGTIREPSPEDDGGDVRDIELTSQQRLALGTINNRKAFPTLTAFGEYVASWTFVDTFRLDLDHMRRPATVEQNPTLSEDGSNLSAVLFHLQSEHPEAFETLNRRMETFYDAFEGVDVKAQGAPGQVLAFVDETGLSGTLTLADVSDGILRLLFWATLCYQPEPPPLVCIDEPAQGVHPRTIPIFAGMLRKLATRTQVLIATHSSYLLSQFDVDDIIVFSRSKGESTAKRPADSEALISSLDTFGSEELQRMHRSDELEFLSEPIEQDALTTDVGRSLV